VRNLHIGDRREMNLMMTS